MDAGQHLDQGRLAGAVLAEQRQDLAGVQVQADIVDGDRAAEALGDARESQQGCVSHQRRAMLGERALPLFRLPGVIVARPCPASTPADKSGHGLCFRHFRPAGPCRYGPRDASEEMHDRQPAAATHRPRLRAALGGAAGAARGGVQPFLAGDRRRGWPGARRPLPDQPLWLALVGDHRLLAGPVRRGGSGARRRQHGRADGLLHPFARPSRLPRRRCACSTPTCPTRPR